MKKGKFRKTRVTKLYRGKVKEVGFIEKMKLKIAGRIDGSRGLPREDGDGNWKSPYLDREIRSYEEYSSRMWGNLQIDEEDTYARLGKLMDSIAFSRNQLAEAKGDLKATVIHSGAVEPIRKHGEDKLTDAQVIARRAKERAKITDPMRTHIENLNNTLKTEMEEFSLLYNRIVEDNNSVRMICNRLKEHMHQRIDIYWGSAMRKHAEKGRMPAVPDVKITSFAEEVYMKPHAALMKKAETFNQTLLDENTEVA